MISRRRRRWAFPGCPRSLLLGVEAGLLPVAAGKALQGAAFCQGGRTSGLPTRTLYFCLRALFFPTFNYSKGLESAAKKAGHCQVPVGEMETEQLSAGRGAGGTGVGDGAPRGGLSAPTLHLPISLQFKKSFHLSASAAGIGLQPRRGGQCSGCWHGWEPGPGRNGRGKARFPAPGFLWDLRRGTRLPWTDRQGRRDKHGDPSTTQTSPSRELVSWVHCTS